MSEATTEQSRDRTRVDAPLKVAGLAPYAYEHETPGALFLAPVLATIARGRITRIDELLESDATPASSPHGTGPTTKE